MDRERFSVLVGVIFVLVFYGLLSEYKFTQVNIATRKHYSLQKPVSPRAIKEKSTRPKLIETTVYHTTIPRRVESKSTLGVHNKSHFFYGLKYLASYGLSQRTQSTEQDFVVPQKRSEEWRNSFPILMKSLAAFKTENPRKNKGFFTAERSQIVLQKTTYSVGETFVARILAKDIKGRNKTFGGDYFRARLLIGDPFLLDPKYAIACRVTDHMDGTYTLEAPLEFAGTLTIDVILAIPAEGVFYLIEESGKKKYKGFWFETELESNETVECNYDINELTQKSKIGDKCDYGNPRNGEPWICAMPKSKVCHPIKYMEGIGDSVSLKLSQTIIKEYRSRIHIDGTGTEIRVLERKANRSSKLLPCSFNQKIDTAIKPSGYLNNGNWVSRHCRNSLNTLTKTRFRNKILYLIGDSTTRQMYFYLAGELRLNNIEAPIGDEVRQRPRISFDKEYNITLYYRCHGPPLRNPGPPTSRIYISDVLDGIQEGGENVTVIFNIGPHISTYHPAMFIKRMTNIKEAALRLIRRQPGTKIILRGYTAHNAPIEWFLYRYQVLLLEIFSDVLSVLYVDLWDLSLVWLMQGDHHAEIRLRKQQALLLANFI